MICPVCGKELVKRPTWSPTLGHQPGFTYSHIYSMQEIFSGKTCTYTTNDLRLGNKKEDDPIEVTTTPLYEAMIKCAVKYIPKVYC